MYQYLSAEEQLYSPYLGGYHSCGIAVFKVCGEQRKQIAFVSDVSVDKMFVEQLAQRCTAAQLDPIHFIDVVLDAIGR